MKSAKQYSLGSRSVGITDGSDLWSKCWDGLRWHDMYTKFHEDWFGYSGNIKVITLTVSEAAVLVLLRGMIYDVYHWDDLRWHNMHMPYFMTISSGIKVILRVIPQKFERLYCWYCWWEEFIMYAVAMASGVMIYVPSPWWSVRGFKWY
jgi:hypothetical protein